VGLKPTMVERLRAWLEWRLRPVRRRGWWRAARYHWMTERGEVYLYHPPRNWVAHHHPYGGRLFPALGFQSALDAMIGFERFCGGHHAETYYGEPYPYTNAYADVCFWCPECWHTIDAHGATCTRCSCQLSREQAYAALGAEGQQKDSGANA
jgi:hypothetical protein